MKRTLCVLLTGSILLGLTGCSINNVKDTEAHEIQLEMITLKKEVEKLSRRLKETNSEIESLRGIIPSKTTGTYSVTATKLNMRQDASSELESMGTIDYGTKINIVDTSNPLWYKVSLDVNFYEGETKDYTTVLKSDTNSIEVKNNYLDTINTFYVSSLYLTSDNVETIIETPVGERPFVYGLNFFDKETGMLLASEIWSNMQGELQALGYTGVVVRAMNRETYIDDVKNSVFDAVESAPGQFAELNSEKEYMRAFAKDVINGETNYSGIIIVNKDSGITDFKKLKGKNVLTGKEYSESSYRYQKYYLKEIEGIDIEKDLKLQKDNYHQEIFYKVATGEVDAGFCGDFVMTNTFGDMKYSLNMSKIELKSKEELEDLRDNIIVLDMSELAPIPNNPHSVKVELASNPDFVNKLYNCVKKVYGQNKEGYDIASAINEEYEMLNDIE